MALFRTDVSEEGIAFIIRVTRIGELGTTLAVTSSNYHFTLLMVTIRSSETSVVIEPHGILHSHRREDLKP
jgi:hypothetical protein